MKVIIYLLFGKVNIMKIINQYKIRYFNNINKIKYLKKY